MGLGDGAANGERQKDGTRRPTTGACTITRAATIVSFRIFSGAVASVIYVTSFCGGSELCTLHGERPPSILRDAPF